MPPVRAMLRSFPRDLRRAISALADSRDLALEA